MARTTASVSRKERVASAARRSVLTRARGQGGAWTAVAVAVYGGRFLRRWWQREEEIVHHQELAPGESVRIIHLTQTRAEMRRQEKAAKKAAKKQRHH